MIPFLLDLRQLLSNKKTVFKKLSDWKSYGTLKISKKISEFRQVDFMKKIGRKFWKENICISEIWFATDSLLSTKHLLLKYFFWPKRYAEIFFHFWDTAIFQLGWKEKWWEVQPVTKILAQLCRAQTWSKNM